MGFPVRKFEKIGRSSGCADHDHDLIHDLSSRLDSLWHYDQYIDNAVGHSNIQKFWETVKSQELDNIDQLKNLIRIEIERDCF